MQGGLKKGSGYTFGHDAKERMEYHRKDFNRVSFIPCNAAGLPSPEVESAIDATKRKLWAVVQNIWRGEFLTGFIKGVQAYGLEGDIGGRKIVDLYVNPDNTTFHWERHDPTGDGKLSDAKSDTEGIMQDSRALLPQHLTSLRGKTAADWGNLTGSIKLDGYCGNAPEVQIPRLKYIFGMQDPGKMSRVLEVARGSSAPSNLKVQGGVYSLDAGKYLWELWYPTVYFKPEDNPYNHIALPMRYFGFVKKLEFTQMVSQTETQTDIKWDMEFIVLQRRDYDMANGM